MPEYHNSGVTFVASICDVTEGDTYVEVTLAEQAIGAPRLAEIRIADQHGVQHSGAVIPLQGLVNALCRIAGVHTLAEKEEAPNA